MRHGEKLDYDRISYAFRYQDKQNALYEGILFCFLFPFIFEPNHCLFWIGILVWIPLIHDIYKWIKIAFAKVKEVGDSFDLKALQFLFNGIAITLITLSICYCTRVTPMVFWWMVAGTIIFATIQPKPEE